MQKDAGQETGRGGAGLEQEINAKEREDTDMDEVDSSRKQTSDEVVGQVNPTVGLRASFG